MELYHIDILLYLIFLLRNTYRSELKLPKAGSELVYFLIITFVIFAILIQCIMAMPQAMFVFIILGLINTFRRRG